MLWRMTFAGAFVFALAASGGYAAVWYLVKTPEAEAPDLLTLELVEAVELASKEGFSVMVEEHEATDLLGEGRVLSQRPAPGTVVKEGTRLRVIIAARP
jgi:beta-lactam-binding protein with PASTA domain